MTHDQGDDQMDGRVDDARLDDALLETARAYHAPPAAPRDAMWERIQAARAAARVTTARVAPAPTTSAVGVQQYRARRVGRRPAWAMPLAAALLLAAGITIGRVSANRATISSPGPAAVARAPASGVTPTSDTPSAEPPADGRVAASDEPGGATSAGRSDHRVPATENLEASSPALAYRLAAAEHLAMTETLLTTVSADARAGRADSSVAAWARDLLGTTRVLLASPAARDPQLARLLEDLELVLAQVAQLPAARGAAAATEELRAIDRAVRRRDVLTRVRAAIPTGPLPAGT